MTQSLHTFWEDSKVKKAPQSQSPNLTIHNLNVAYKNGAIDTQEVSYSQKHRSFSNFRSFGCTPALMKEWQDCVLTDIPYGENPKLLNGKSFQVITTLGGAKIATMDTTDIAQRRS